MRLVPNALFCPSDTRAQLLVCRTNVFFLENEQNSCDWCVLLHRSLTKELSVYGTKENRISIAGGFL
ncbi:uncharacterized protein YALI1_A05284g [Yarrowia lipolytica]|uniref:Uncharacterized protein n=1 Tax=Yarrowia lipolytica TaxID=4952 RepID=A0A1D8N3R4_YARLL|nr:hypothetical protein YALI1_A05284g [Yarrowia lipolytica]